MSNRSTSHIEQVHRLFDEKATNWSAHYTSDGRLVSRLTGLTAVVTDQTPGGSDILDFGCGTGELARQLAISGFRVTGCDVSGKMLAQASSTDTGSSVKWVQLDPAWQVLPFTTASFSTVVAASVLEYTESPGHVFAECARILRPGGTLVCTVPNLIHPVRWLERPAQRIAQSPLLRNLAIANNSGRLKSYLTYLSISQQRHRVSRWAVIAGQAGLQTTSFPVKTAGRSTLRLLIFKSISAPRE
jgi:2-polyprenyl-3-methyl-5-hydroxy-6-metoxy-1,4-benzoquinol methylase